MDGVWSQESDVARGRPWWVGRDGGEKAKAERDAGVVGPAGAVGERVRRALTSQRRHLRNKLSSSRFSLRCLSQLANFQLEFNLEKIRNLQASFFFLSMKKQGQG